jgi:hypothetical protein
VRVGHGQFLRVIVLQTSWTNWLAAHSLLTSLTLCVA